MKAFKYNYLVASLLPLTLAMLWWWSIILASVVSLAIFFAVHVADTLTGRQFQKIGSHVVTRFDKVRICNERKDTFTPLPLFGVY